MGAKWFEDSSKGTDVDRVFWKIVEQALWDYGHAGYSGTIAEKNEYVVFTLPKNIPAETFINWVKAATWNSDLEAVPPQHQELVMKAADVAGDKWGPCCAVKDGDAWYFFGFASS